MRFSNEKKDQEEGKWILYILNADNKQLRIDNAIMNLLSKIRKKIFFQHVEDNEKWILYEKKKQEILYLNRF